MSELENKITNLIYILKKFRSIGEICLHDKFQLCSALEMLTRKASTEGLIHLCI